MKWKSYVLELLIGALVFLGALYVFSFLFPPKISFENQADGFAYYLPLRSFYFDGDFQFSNENWSYELFYKRLPYDWKHLTPTGYNIYPYSTGLSILWFPATKLFSQEYRPGLISPLRQTTQRVWPLPGYSAHSLKILVYGSWFYGLLSLIFTYLFLREFSQDKLLTWISIFFAFFAGSFLYYFLYQPLMAHVLSAFGVSLFLFIWSVKIMKKNWFNWLMVGLALGLAALIRWQNSLLLLFPITEFLFLMGKKLEFKKCLWGFLALIGGFLLTFFPQIIFWKEVYGRFLVFPQGKGFFSLKLVNLANFLFSWRHGLLTWTPVVSFALIGVFWSLWVARTGRASQKMKIVLWASALVVAGSICLNSFNIDWHGSDSFGARRTVALTPIFALGIGLFLKKIGKLSWMFSVFCLILVFYNIIFSVQFSRWMVDHSGEVYPRQVLENGVVMTRELLTRWNDF